MRRTGLMDRNERYGLRDHACWAYEAGGERAAVAAEWITDGLALGQRAMYVAEAPRAQLIDELAGVPGRDGAIAGGALVVVESRDLYDYSAPIDAPAQLARYSAAVEEAIADGFAGIRVAADITALVTDPSRRRAHLRWEQFADRYITGQPLAPLCLYDRRQVDDFAAVEHIHPLAGPAPVPFSLYAVGPSRSALSGELDALTVGPLAEALATLPDGDGTLVASSLRFIDVGGATLLHQALVRRREAGRPLLLDGVSPLVREVWTACGFDTTLLGRRPRALATPVRGRRP